MTGGPRERDETPHPQSGSKACAISIIASVQFQIIDDIE